MKNYFRVSVIRWSHLYIYSLLSLSALYPAKAQCPVADFTLPDTVCIGENIRIENNSTGAVGYEWDFCDDELINSIPKYTTVFSNNLFSTAIGVDFVKDNNKWYGFVAREGSILRLDFDENLESTPQITEFNNLNVLLDRPFAIELFQVENQWQGLVVDFRSSKLFLLNFENGINEQPTVSQVASTLINTPSDLEIIKKNDNTIVAFITNGNDGEGSVVRLNFGNSLSSTPIEDIFIIPGSDRIRGISFLKNTCEAYEAVVSSYDNKRVFRLNFNNDIDIPPAINTLSNLGYGLDNLANLKYVKQQGAHVIFVQSRNGIFYKYLLDSNKNTIGIANYGKVDNNALGFNMVKDRTSWVGFSIDFVNNRLNKINFPEDCSNISTSFTSETSPDNITYTSSGDFLVSLNLSNESGNTIDTFKTIHVRESVAPNLDFTFPSVCSTSPSQFALTSDQILTSTAWYINEDTLTGETINYTFPSPSTYPVTLEVESADGCGQRVTKDITIYEPPEPRFVVDKEVICTNGEIAFQNLTDTKGADEIITYAWDFNGEGSSTEANPTFSFSSGGSKTVSLTASIPGCSNTFDTTFVVEQGPVVNFSIPPQICQGEEIIFENLSSGEDITGYRWSFGDGGTYSSTVLESPSYVYDSAGTYIATLEVNNTIGCANTLSKIITIYARPQAAFTADIACAGAPTQFVDESTTGINSNVVAWEWDFGAGTGTSQARNPQYTYTLPGVYDATLVVLTSAGCTDTLSQEIIVESAVLADFSAQSLCPSASDPFTVQFTDVSTVNDEEEISEWLWTINGENFVIADPAYTFEQPGTYQVSLTVFSATACNASVTKNITIATPPAPDFSFVANCAGQPVSFSNESLSEAVAISQYRWDFGGLGISYEENPEFIFEEAGSYQVSLSLETSEGCEYTYSQEVNVPAAPQAAFTADMVYGGAPLTVNFSNTSTGADSVRWDFGGEATANEANPSYTFSEPGTYTVTLKALSDLGCTDVYSETIEVVSPFSNLQLQRISLLSEEDDPNVRLLLTIRNLGNLTVSDFDIAITLDEVLTITESFEGSIEPGEIINYPLDFTISSQINQDIDLRYICATLSALPEEDDITDNRTCLSLNNDFSVIAPYPNPSAEKIKVDMVLPQKEIVRFSMLTTKGELVENIIFSDTKVGLNTFNIDVSKMITGKYFLQVGYLDRTETYRLMVRP